MKKLILFCLLLLVNVEVQAKSAAFTTKCHPDIILKVRDKLLKDDPTIATIDDTKTTVVLVNSTYNSRLKVEHQVHYIEFYTLAGTTIHVSTESNVTRGNVCRRTNLKIYLLTE